METLNSLAVSPCETRGRRRIFARLRAVSRERAPFRTCDETRANARGEWVAIEKRTADKIYIQPFVARRRRARLPRTKGEDESARVLANMIYPRMTIYYQCRELHIGNYCGGPA